MHAVTAKTSKRVQDANLAHEPESSSSSKTGQTMTQGYHCFGLSVLPGLKRLIAGYMFKRGEQDRNDTNRLFSTLATQLADTVSLFKESLRNSLEGLDKDAVDKSSLENQFQKLLWDPLESLNLEEINRLPGIIVIDALDECERLENLTRLLGLFSKLCTISTLRLRVLITSRYAPEIIEAFEPLVKEKTVHTLELHREFSGDTTLDIRNFLEARFADIKHRRRVQKDPWPTMDDLDRLVQLSTTPEPLFIYAATLCRFVSDKNRGPIQQLITWLEQGSKSQLHQIYSPILDQAFSGFHEGEFRQKLRYLGTVVLLARPLSAKSLTLLLRTDLDDISWWTCKDLRHDFAPFVKDSIRVIVAFIAIIEHAPLQIYGSSIFFSPTGSIVRQRFWHQRIPKTGEIQGVEANWSARLQVIQSSEGTVKLHVFSPNGHFLASVVEKGLVSIGKYEIQLRNITTGTHLYALSTTSMSIKAIAFSADSRHLAAADSNRFIRLWDVKSGHVQQIAIGYIEEPIAINFPSDINLVVSVSQNGTVQYWERLKNAYQEIVSKRRTVTKDSNLRTSRNRRRSHGHCTTQVRLLLATLSPCMQLLAFQSVDAFCVQIWNFATYAQKSPVKETYLTFTSGSPFPIRFSPDSRLLAIVHAKVLNIWDVETSAQKLSLKHDHHIDAITFSPCGRTIASSAREKIQLWDLQTGVLKTTLIEDGTVSALTFAPDGSTLASPQHLWDVTKPREYRLSSGDEDKQLCIWSMMSGARQETFPSSISDVVYSPDGQSVATTYWLQFGGELALWEADTGQCLHILDGTRMFVEDKEIRLRGEKKLREPLRAQWTFANTEPAETVTTMAFSSDGKFLAIGSEQGTIRVWDTSSGTQTRWTIRQEGLIRSIRVLPDELIVSVSDIPPFFNLWNDMKLRIHRYRTTTFTTEESLEQFPDDSGLRYDTDWIKQGSENILWVPPQYRPTDGSVAGWICQNSATIFIGSVSGHVIRFQCV
ncbi:uncharacterized protein FFFS_14652 [Fusarium fujikuroi]|nr:uncharacterized protein FFFS_14652 [Fusarium fujikuroi]